MTPSQLKTFKFIQRFIQKHHYAPTTAEIAQGIGIQSRGVVHRYLKSLVAAGAITLEPKRHRNIRLNPDFVWQQQHHLPLIGAIAAGKPIEAILQDEAIDVASIFLGDERYALRVKGDSMQDEGIFDGDIIICQRSDTASDGDIVVALIDHEEATLKRLQRNTNGTITLIPANASHQAMIYPADRVTVQGIFIGLLRAPLKIQAAREKQRKI